MGVPLLHSPRWPVAPEQKALFALPNSIGEPYPRLKYVPIDDQPFDIGRQPSNFYDSSRMAMALMPSAQIPTSGEPLVDSPRRFARYSHENNEPWRQEYPAMRREPAWSDRVFGVSARR